MLFFLVPILILLYIGGIPISFGFWKAYFHNRGSCSWSYLENCSDSDCTWYAMWLTLVWPVSAFVVMGVTSGQKVCKALYRVGVKLAQTGKNLAKKDV